MWNWRGYVVLAVDQPNHGDSEIRKLSGSILFAADGVYQGALALIVVTVAYGINAIIVGLLTIMNICSMPV